MFQFINYNFFADGDCLNTCPSSVDSINSVTLTNAIFDHLNVTRNINTEVTTSIPQKWDYDTIMDAPFNGNLNAGNVDFLVEQIIGIKIKRRKINESNWLTLTTIPINTVEDLNFTFNDMLNAYGVEYEYAFIPIMAGNVEGTYELNNTILSQFNGVFIGNADTIYKFLYEVKYGNNQRNQKVGIFQVLGKQFPVFVANGQLSYESGSVTATLLNDDYQKTGVIDRVQITQKKDALKDFLTDKTPKILKDWNGNIWLCIINDNVSLNYKENFGMGIPVITFNWTEIGHADNQQDLYNNGIITEVN